MDADFERIFNAIPANYIVLDLEWNIVAITDMATGGRPRSQIIGRSQFEVFPDNPDDEGDVSGTATMRAALERAVREKVGHAMPVTRYDVADAHGVFQERHWRPINEPVLDAAGDVVYVIHGVEEVTNA
ncbi:hypothetical protein FB382_003156 [Nocardioides ginsengisegetis]|uniref:PAS fold-4 domain-containing protein n=1 Tax=Nocardioides ginsengisegetis TaxID=661491 RepID=A0A7W3J214_9ACTN|nr:PAS domain-containing protein [Nocardioides ginsengisegetis]MBA8804865.1 hypothetical protein [Nocardioides ginsengisegetis]